MVEIKKELALVNSEDGKKIKLARISEENLKKAEYIQGLTLVK